MKIQPALTGFLALLASLLAAPTAAIAQGDGLSSDVVQFRTSMGPITVFLDEEHAPITTDHIRRLVEEGFYDGLVIHRVLPTSPDELSIIQGGGFTDEFGVREPPFGENGIENEWENGLRHVRGTIAMARRGGQPNSATTQWFINTTDNPTLDTPRDGAGYAVFGTVVDGMDLAADMSNVATDRRTTLENNIVLRNVPVENIMIEEAVLLPEGEVTAEMRRAIETWNERAAMMASEGQERLRQQRLEAAERQCLRQFAGRINRERTQTFQTQQQAMSERFDRVVGQLDGVEAEENGLVVLYTERNSGEAIEAGDMLNVHLTMWNADNGEALYSTRLVDGENPIPFTVEELPNKNMGPIEALQEVVLESTLGDSLLVRVPAALAYGADGERVARIPGDTDLIFEITPVSKVPTFEAVTEMLDGDSAQETESGIEYVTLQAGEGAVADANDYVTTTYSGWLTDGTRFDSNLAPFSPRQVISGWTESLTDMQEGEIRVVRIPSELAYGSRGAPPRIPADATLVFYIHLRDVMSFQDFLTNDCAAYEAALEGERPTQTQEGRRGLNTGVERREMLRRESNNNGGEGR